MAKIWTNEERSMQREHLKEFLLLKCFFGPKNYALSSELFREFSLHRASFGMSLLLNNHQFKKLMEEISNEKEEPLLFKEHRIGQGCAYLGISLHEGSVLKHLRKKRFVVPIVLKKRIGKTLKPEERQFQVAVKEALEKELHLSKLDFQQLKSQNLLRRIRNETTNFINIEASIKATIEVVKEYLEKTKSIQMERQDEDKVRASRLLQSINEELKYLS